MIRSLISVLFCLFFNHVVIAQEESDYVNEVSVFDVGNQVELDFEVLAVSVGMKWRIADRWQLGPSFGFGVGLVGGCFQDGSVKGSGFYGVEAIHLGLVFKYLKSEKLNFEIEPKVAAVVWWGNNSGNFGSGVGLLGMSCYYGKKVQLGWRLTVGYGSENVFGYSSFLVLRIPLAKW